VLARRKIRGRGEPVHLLHGKVLIIRDKEKGDRQSKKGNGLSQNTSETIGEGSMEENALTVNWGSSSIKKGEVKQNRMKKDGGRDNSGLNPRHRR